MTESPPNHPRGMATQLQNLRGSSDESVQNAGSQQNIPQQENVPWRRREYENPPHTWPKHSPKQHRPAYRSEQHLIRHPYEDATMHKAKKAIRVWSRTFRPTREVIDQRPKKRGRRTLPPQPTDRITRASIRNEPVQQTTPVPINSPPAVRRTERSSSQPPPMSERQDVGPRLLLNRALGPENPAPPQSEEGMHRWQAESSLAQSSQTRRQSLRKKQAPKHHQDYQTSTSKKYSKK